MILYPSSIPFSRNNNIIDTSAELDINFNVGKSDFNKLVEFVTLYKDKRINITFKGGEFPVGWIGLLNKTTDNVYIRLDISQMKFIAELKNRGYKYFLDANCPAYNFTMLLSFIELGVTDVYPADDLWYCMDEVKEICNKHNIRIRLVCNRIPLTSLDRGSNCKAPLFSPLNREVLDKYVDTYEFDCGDPIDNAKLDVLYRAWFIREGWNGDLREINSDLQFSYPLLAIPQSIVKYKLNCGLRCKRPSNACKKCKQYIELGENLVNVGAYIKSNKRHGRK